MNNQIKAFVSSTFEDLKEHRSYVIQALRDAGIHVDPMENWTADSSEPKQFSKERVTGCDLCILLVAFRRGYIPEGEKDSITQMEYRYAIEQGIDVLSFLLDDDAPWPRRFDEMERDPGIKKWREELRARHGAPFFGHDPSSIKIEPAISRWIKDKSSKAVRAESISISWTLDDLRKAARKASDDYLDKMQRERVYLPNLYSQRTRLEAHLNGFLDHTCTKTGMIIVGASGIGKTNTLCHIVKQWRDDPEKLGSDVVLLVGGSTLPGGKFDFRDVLLDRMEFSDNATKFVSQFTSLCKSNNSQMVIIVDGVDKHPQSDDLLKQLDNLIIRSEAFPWLKTVISIGEVTYNAIRKAGFIPATRTYYTVAMNEGTIASETAEISLGRMTDEELADAYEKYRQEPGFAPISTFESLSEDVKNAMRNPLFLRIVMEVFNVRKIPRRVLTAEVLLEYCNKKVFGNPKRLFFINRFVDLLHDNRLKAARFDEMLQVPELRQILLDTDPQSPYMQLLDEQVLEEQFKRVSAILPAQRSIAFTYDRLLEYLLLNRIVERFGLDSNTIVNLSEQAIKYLPLRGTLTTLFLAKVDEGSFEEVAKLLKMANPEVMNSVTIELSMEIEQMSPTNANTSDTELAETPLGQLVNAIVNNPNDWTNRILTAFCENLMRTGFYRRAEYTYKSLLNIIDESTEPLLTARIRQGLGEINSNFGRKQEALDNYEQSLIHYKKISDKNGEQSILDAIGLIYLDLGKIDISKDYFEQSLKIDRELVKENKTIEAQKGEAQSLMHLSEYYLRTGEINKAIKSIEEASKIFSSVDDKRGLADSLNRIGWIQSKQGLFEETKPYYLKALEVHKQIGDKRGAARDILSLACTNHFQGKWDKALSLYQDALDVYQDIGFKLGIANTLTNIGETCRQSGKFEEALENYKNALSLFEEISDKNGISISLNNIGASYLFSNDYEKAIEFLLKAADIQKELWKVDGILETLAYLSFSMLKMGRTQEAIHYSDKAFEIFQKRRFSEEDIQLVYYYRYEILREIGKEAEALEALQNAYKDIIQQSDVIKDDETRECFIENFTLRRDIIKAWKTENERSK